MTQYQVPRLCPSLEGLKAIEIDGHNGKSKSWIVIHILNHSGQALEELGPFGKPLRT